MPRRRARFELLLLTLYLATNICCMFVGVTCRGQISARSGVLAVINLVPALLDSRLNASAQAWGMSLHSTLVLHRSTALVAISQGLVHGGLALRTLMTVQWNATNVVAVNVGSSRGTERDRVPDPDRAECSVIVLDRPCLSSTPPVPVSVSTGPSTATHFPARPGHHRSLASSVPPAASSSALHLRGYRAGGFEPSSAHTGF